jgi:hypothetical protein
MSNKITDEQILAAFDEHQDRTKAAESLNCSYDFYRKRLKKLLSIEPAEREGFSVTRTTTLEDENGNIKLEWVRRDKDKEEQENALRAFVDGLKAEIKPVKPITPPAQKPAHLLNQYTITDYHLGMMATESESGTDWDIEKAEELLVNWFNVAINQAPDAHTAIFANLGDAMQWEGMTAKTPTHGNILDASTRYGVLTDVYIRSIRKIISLLLQKHNQVHIIMCPGNHDPSAPNIHSKWLNVLYENEPRVTVDTSDSLYFAYEFGANSFFYHHGHRRNLRNVAETWVTKFREIYGRTKFSYGNTGHLHNENVRRDTGVKITQHPTLAPHDAHSAGGGYDEERLAKVTTFHREFGQCGTVELTPEMVKNFTE